MPETKANSNQTTAKKDTNKSKNASVKVTEVKVQDDKKPKATETKTTEKKPAKIKTTAEKPAKTIKITTNAKSDGDKKNSSEKAKTPDTKKPATKADKESNKSAKSAKTSPKSETTTVKTKSSAEAKKSKITTPAKSETTAKSKPATKKAPATQAKTKASTSKKPVAKTVKKSGKAIDAFTIPTDRKKTIAGDTNLDLKDLEKRVEDYELENTPSKKPKKAKETSKLKLKNLDSKPRKIFRIIGAALSLLLLISSAVLGAMVVIINLLPNMYLIPALAVLAIIAVGFSIIMVHHKINPAVKTPFFLLSIILSAVYIFGITYLDKTFDFFDNLKGQDYLTESYYVVVEKNSDYKDIHDLRGKTVATYDEGIEIYQEAIKKLQALVKVEFQTVDAIGALSTSLSEHTADAVLISAVHQEVLNDLAEDGAESFSATTRILYTIEVRVDTKDELTEVDINIATEPFTTYISGIDAYGDMSNMQRGRSDVNMLATVNPKTHEVLLTSIPRDYYVQLHGTTGHRDKLTHAGIYGVQMSIDTLEDLLDIKIDYYLKVNFSTVVKLVDTIGGIDVYSDQQFVPWTNRGITIPKGNVHMDGAMALAFARERKSYATGDRHRVQNQQDVISAIIKKISGSTVLLTKYAEILDSLSSCLTTNIGKNEISSLAKLQLQSMPSWQIGQYSLNGSDSHNYTYSMGQQLLYVMEPNLQTVRTAHNNITAIIKGKPLSELTLTEK